MFMTGVLCTVCGAQVYFRMMNDCHCQAKGLWRNLILLKHISISLHGYRECLNSACEIGILEGYIKGKVKQLTSLKVMTNRRCPCRILKETSTKCTKMYTPFYYGFFLTIWTICAFRVLNPRQWSLAKQSSSKSWRVMPKSAETR